jgi:hypothetical protein
MPILTPQEACDRLRFSKVEEMPTDVITVLLPAVDSFIKDATGKDWGTLTDTYKTIDSTAKMAASILLIRWFENSDETGKGGIGVIGLIGQLQAKYQQELQAAIT